MELNSGINWNLVPINYPVMVSDDEEHWYKGYFYRQVEDGFQTFPEPMNYVKNLSNYPATWYYIKPVEDVTVEKLIENYDKYCMQFSFEDCQNNKCKYKKYDERGQNLCHYNWLLDHYNLTEKE